MVDSPIRSDVSMLKVPKSGRLASLDQFRGYTVLGMIVVNFLGSFHVVHSVFKHNDTYFSFADSIMPAFHFAVGFSFRLTMLRRLAEFGFIKTWTGYLRRSFALVFVAVLFFGVGGQFREWRQFSEYPKTGLLAADAASSVSSSETTVSRDGDTHAFRATFCAQWRAYFAHLLKSRMWNTFAIIGVTQIVVLPFVACSLRVRLLAMLMFGLAHAALTEWFNWGFIRGDATNWMVKLWGTGADVSWDGGFFGPLCWAVVMLGGTVACDIVCATGRSGRAVRRLLWTGCALMVIAWSLSCLTRMYDVEYGPAVSQQLPGTAASPVIPSFSSLRIRHPRTLLAELPFVAPPPESVRLQNYWMMSKQIPTLPFILSATGFSFLVCSFFVLVCDAGGYTLPVFRTFGTNPLAAYCIHSAIGDQLGSLMPGDAPLWYVLIGLMCFILSTWSCVRFLERSHIFIRL